MRQAPAPNREPELLIRKKLDWEMLKQWSEEGIICLKYLDESGCYCQSPTDYSYSQRGKQKRLVQNHRRGRRINIFGVWQPKQKLDYALMLGNFQGETYLRLMNWQALTSTRKIESNRTMDSNSLR
jgi:putative transposase